MCRVIKFNQKAGLKPHINVNTELKKIFIEAAESSNFWRNHITSKKTQGYQTRDNRNKKELCGVRTKLPCNKTVFRKFISNGNKRHKISHQQTNLLRSINIRNQ